jgi:hypothetical protein
MPLTQRFPTAGAQHGGSKGTAKTFELLKKHTNVFTLTTSKLNFF